MAVDISAIDREITRRTVLLNEDMKAGKLAAWDIYWTIINKLLDARLEAMKAQAKTVEPA